MPLPKPFPGLVLHYSYLWRDERVRGLEEGRKDRPCVIAAVLEGEGGPVALVTPITHRRPSPPSIGIEIPPVTSQRLGLDHDRSWIIVTELNRFQWPGVDLRPIPKTGQFAYGMLPPRLFSQVSAALRDAAGARTLQATPR